MAQDGTRKYSTWIELAERASQETDPEKLMRIIEELCRVLDRETVPDSAQVRPSRSGQDGQGVTE
jgi:hypothetical protein